MIEKSMRTRPKCHIKCQKLCDATHFSSSFFSEQLDLVHRLFFARMRYCALMQ